MYNFPFVQGDQIVSVHLMMYCNRQVHKDILITLYVSARLWLLYRLAETCSLTF